MARTDYGAILSTVIKDTSDAVREVNGTSSLIAPNQWGTAIRTMHSDSDYDNALEQMIEETATGDIASFSDGANNIPCPSVLCTINPVQDLHGQDYPYPSGGGINKWDEEWEVGGYDSSGNKQANPNIIRSKNKIVIGANTQFYFKCGNSNPTARFVFWDSNDNLISATAGYDCNAVNTSPNNAYYMAFNIGANYGNTYKNDISINIPSSNTAYHPYSNICPITGHTDCTVTNDKYYGGEIDFNQLAKWDNTYPSSYVTINSYSDSGYNFTLSNNSGWQLVTFTKSINTFIENHKYFFACECQFSSAVSSNCLFVLGGTSNQGTPTISLDNTSTSKQKKATIVNCNITSQANVFFQSYNISTTVDIQNIMVIDLTQMFGETKADEIYAMEQATSGSGVAYVRSILPHDYYDYTVSTVETAMEANGEVNPEATTDLGTTVYGGTLEVVSGVLTLDRGMIKLSDINWTSATSNPPIFRGVLSSIPNIQIPPNNAVPTTAITESFSAYAYSPLSSSTIGKFAVSDGGSNRIVFIDDSVNTLEAFLQKYGNDIFVYPLATPTTTQLTPQEVKSLLGSNNFYHDCNGQVAVTYKANGELYVEQHT